MPGAGAGAGAKASNYIYSVVHDLTLSSHRCCSWPESGGADSGPRCARVSWCSLVHVRVGSIESLSGLVRFILLSLFYNRLCRCVPNIAEKTFRSTCSSLAVRARWIC